MREGTNISVATVAMSKSWEGGLETSAVPRGEEPFMSHLGAKTYILQATWGRSRAFFGRVTY